MARSLWVAALSYRGVPMIYWTATSMVTLVEMVASFESVPVTWTW
uniref:LmbE family protein n=1 Tax=mine drainage metagenome TaxID=410659 RepID=E6QHN5_9ZZZZ